MTPLVVADIVLLLLIVVTAIATVTTRSLLTASMLLAVYSLLVAATWVDLQAPDVAFTEAAVGAGVSTVFLLAALVRTGWKELPSQRVNWPALVVAALVACALAAGSADLPPVGDPNSVAIRHVGGWYLEHAREQTHVPNIVTAVLASYRGYDTLFETAVIFTAGATVLLLLGRREPRPAEHPETKP